MTTTAEPDVDQETTEPVQEQQPAAPADDLSGIDEAIRQAQTEQDEAHEEETEDGDPRPDSLLAAMKVLAPPHAVFDSKSRLPGIMDKIAEAIGAEVDASMKAYNVYWTTGENTWQPTGLYQVGWAREGCMCGGHPDRDKGYHLEVAAPGKKVSEDGLTTDQAVALLRALRIIN